MDRIEIDGTPYVAPFKSRLAQTDEVYITDSNKRRLAVLNTYTQRPSSDVEGRELEKNEAITIGNFIVDALNEKAQRVAFEAAPASAAPPGWAGRYTSVTIKVLGRVTDPDAFAEFCAAVDSDLGRDPGTTLAASVPAYLDEGPAFKIDALVVDYGYVEKTKETAVRHGIDIIVACGPADEHLGSIYTVRDGYVSKSLGYDPVHDRILLDAQTLDELARDNLDNVRDVTYFLEKYGEGSFDPFFLDHAVYQFATGQSSSPRPR